MALPLREIGAYLIDLDGVLVRGEQCLPGTVPFLEWLRSQRFPFCILTNNSTRTPEAYASFLSRVGVPVQASEVLTSAVVTAAALRRSAPGARVFVIGSPALREVLASHGLLVDETAAVADVVVVGLDRGLSYEKLSEAALAIRRGARFVATNADASFPSERGLEPGAGALVAALETTTGQRAEIFGKPEPAMFEEGLRRVGVPAGRTAIVGDRLETDIIGGRRAGLVTIAVASGSTPLEHLEKANPLPDYVVTSVAGLLRALAG